ncbi:MAG TPA: ankyrin repeat domain-containing protein, partial [Gaiellales bacterium]|nr:ankyrin repeat domain-containing protein [Gaiellales bacterium]
ETLRELLAEHPALATARIAGCRTLLHVATDWPGHHPNGPATVAALVAAGADVDAPFAGRAHRETPLHWAASSDDSDVAAALIDGGADLEVPGASIAGGPPLDDAVGYGCWHVARLLVARGARVEQLWKAAALGQQSRVMELVEGDPQPTEDELNHAFWQACHGGQRRIADYLLSRGADINAVPGHTDRTPLDIAGSPSTRRETLIDWLRGHGAISSDS